jgi:hypothetical protein
MIPISLSFTTLRAFARLLAILNIMALAGTTFVLWAFPHRLPPSFSGPSRSMIISQFNLASENVAVTWYSSMILLITGVLAVLCYLATDKTTAGKEGWLMRGWVLIALMFFLLSLDELGSLHENAGRLAQLDIIGDDSWESVLAIPGGIVVLYLLAFGWLHLRKYHATFIFMAVGTLLFATVPFQEHLEFALAPVGINSDAIGRPIYLVLLEEGAELFGAWAFIMSMILYLRHHGDKAEQKIILRLDPNTLYPSLLAAVILLAFVFLFFHQFASTLHDDEGIAINWFPCAIVMITASMRSLLFEDRYRWYIMVYSSLLSCYLGANFYTLLKWDEITKLILIIRIVMIPGLVVYLYLMAKPFNSTVSRLIVYFSGVLILAAFIFTKPMVTASVFVGAVVIGAVIVYEKNVEVKICKSV